MEDAHVAVLDLGAHYGAAATSSGPLHFFAVFDGHGGRSAAAFAAARLLDCVVEAGRCGGGAGGGAPSGGAAGAPPPASSSPPPAASTLASAPGAALAAGFAALDEAFYEAVVVEAALPDSGTTALAALVDAGTGALTVANAGDSRAVLCRGGLAVPLTTDHRPGVPAEAARIAASGGVVCPDGFLNACLGVARGVGDFCGGAGAGLLKARDAASGALTGGPLTAAPEVHTTAVDCTPGPGRGGPSGPGGGPGGRGGRDEFLILACDGLWDSLSSDRAVAEVRAHLRAHGDPSAAAAHVVACALAAQSSDNVTAVVVCFDGGEGGGEPGSGGEGGAPAPAPAPAPHPKRHHRHPPRSLSRGSLCTLSDALESCSSPPPPPPPHPAAAAAAAAAAAGRVSPGGAVAAAVAAMVVGSGPDGPRPGLPRSAWPGGGGAPAALVVAGRGEAAIVGPGAGAGAGAVGRVAPVGAGGRGGVPPSPPASAEAA